MNANSIHNKRVNCIEYTLKVNLCYNILGFALILYCFNSKPIDFIMLKGEYYEKVIFDYFNII